ncbi:MAG: protein-glutamine glutaminase family protein [Pirellulaceae bacterium]
MPQETEVLRVADIREQAAPDIREVLFLERHSFYEVRLSAPDGPATLATLQQARQSSDPVRVVLDTDKHEVLSAQLLSAGEKSNFVSLITTLTHPDPTRPIDANNINAGTFNIVGDYLKSSAFDVCTTIVPNFAEAVRLFDICTAHSCHPAAPAPCITFQYLIDGCYARAHKMRYFIEQEGYCCEKAFAFAMTAPNKLSVRASLWGCCCVSWWWHVAPLIRVDMDKLYVAAMVIDPGMFTRPVLFSTWLAALEDKCCYPQAKVVTYSIQKGEAYGPNDLAGATYSLDDLYTQTDAFLKKYQHHKTCP